MAAEVKEEAATFAERDPSAALAGTSFEGMARFRTFGACGPMYQVLWIEGDHARVWLSNSDEESVLSRSSLLDDPTTAAPAMTSAAGFERMAFGVSKDRCISARTPISRLSHSP